MLLNQLLSSNKYQTVERNCSITLTASEKNEETIWEIKRTTTLENDLVGGLMNYLSDPIFSHLRIPFLCIWTR